MRSKKTSRTIFLLFLSFILASGVSSAAPEKKTDFFKPDGRIPSIEHFMKMGYATKPIISPDGETIYFSNNFISPRQLFRVNDKVPYPYLLTFMNKAVLYPSLSPDGKWMLFLCDQGGNEQYQLYILNTTTGAYRQVTDQPKVRFGQAVWAPDSKTIYFRANRERPRDFSVYSMDLCTGKMTLLIDQPGYWGPSGVSPDGRYLACYRYNSNVDVNLYLLDLVDGKKTLITPHKGKVKNYFVSMSADNRTVYFLTDNNPKGVIKLAAMDRKSGKFEIIYDKESQWGVDDAFASPRGDVAGLIINRDGYGDLRLLDLYARKDLPVPDLDGVVINVSLSDTSKVAYSFAKPTRTTDVFIWDWKTKQNRQISYSSYLGIDTAKFVKPKLIRYKSFDGLKIPAFLYLPPNWEKNKGNIPFILHFHGGPEGQSRPYFQRHYNYLLMHGFGIMAPNVRGSEGYGRDYMALDNYKSRLGSVKDGYWAAKYLIDQGYTRKGKIGIKGASYGGYMVMALITEFPDMWGAAYESVGIVDFENFLKNTKPYRRKLREAEYGPLTDLEFLRSISPIHKLDRVKTPLMVSHGKNDPRVPVSEAYLIINTLKKRGVKVKALIFEDEGHGVRKLKNRLRLYREMVDFFKENLK